MRYDLVIFVDKDNEELFEDLEFPDRIITNDHIVVDRVEYKITSKCHFKRRNPRLFGEPV